jgi:UDP-N-acetylmuramate dehydrogenase
MNIIKNISLKNYNTFGIDIKAKYFVEIYSEDDLINIYTSELFSELQKLIIGNGSNILFTKDFDGIVIKNSIPGIKILNEDDRNVIVEAGAGVIWDDLVQYCVNKNFGGIENLSLIPGTVGAAPIQNIGAYGQELKDTLYKLAGFFVDRYNSKIFTNSECNFSYRSSIFKNELKEKFIITSVVLKLDKNPVVNTSYKGIEDELDKIDITNVNIKDVRNSVINLRKKKLPDPDELSNAGSFFKNPVITNDKLLEMKKEYADLNYFPADDDQIKISAAWLIEQCGWKGEKTGNVGTYTKQALVIVNYSDARGIEILELAEKINKSVNSKFGITLENEVEIL